jgi:hypothetical protein
LLTASLETPSDAAEALAAPRNAKAATLSWMNERTRNIFASSVN